MPPKANKTTSSTAPLFRPTAQASPSAAAAGTVPSFDMSALKAELVQAVVAELQTALSDHHSKIRAELQDMKAELSRDFAATKSEFASIQKTIAGVEQSLTACTDDVVTLQGKVEFLTKELCRLDMKCEDLESRSRRQNLRLIGIPEDSGFIVSAANVAKLLHEAFSLDECPRVDRAHRSLGPKPQPGGRPRPIIVRLHYYEDCVNILTRAKRLQCVTASGLTFSAFPHFTTKVAKARAALNGIRTQLQSIKGVKYGLFYPACLRISYEDKHRRFHVSRGSRTVYCYSTELKKWPR